MTHPEVEGGWTRFVGEGAVLWWLSWMRVVSPRSLSVATGGSHYYSRRIDEGVAGWAWLRDQQRTLEGGDG